MFPLDFTEYPGHIVDLYCVGLSNATPFCKNYEKLNFALNF